MNFTNFPLSRGGAEVIIRSIPEVRIAAYVRETSGSLERSAQMYLWNSYMASVVQRSTGLVEVQIRNALGAGTEPVHIYTARLRRILRIRNRAAHHRPLLDTRPLNDAHRDCVDTLRMIDVPLSRWFRAEKWIPSAIAEKP